MSISIRTSGSVLPDSEISEAELGGEYLGWTGFPGWKNQAEYLGIHHIRWPAGNIAEDRIENSAYAFDISQPNIVDNWPLWNGLPRPGIAEMFAYCEATGASLAMIVPTARYVESMRDNPQEAKDWIASDIQAFTERLFAGEWGTIPDNFTLEIGAEYYSTDAWAKNADDQSIEMYFSEVFAEVVVNLAEAESAYGYNVYEIAVQASRFQSSDDTATEQNGQLGDATVFLESYLERDLNDSIDALIWHRYVYTFDQISHHIMPTELVTEHTLSDQVELWERVLGTKLNLIVGWASPDIDSEGASDSNPNFDYGPRSAHNLLQMFSALAASSAEVSTLYGIDSPWVGAVSTGSTNPNEFEVFFAGEVYKLMAESLPGSSVTNQFEQNQVYTDASNGLIDRDAVNVFNFSNGSSGLVSFVAVWKLESEAVDIVYEPTFSQGATFSKTTAIIPTTLDFDALAQYITADVSTSNGQVSVHNLPSFAVVRTEFVSNLVATDFTAENNTISDTSRDRVFATLTNGADHFEIKHLQNDTFTAGLEGNDTILGSLSQDIFFGGSGSDSLDGREGDDIIFGDVTCSQFILDWIESEDIYFDENCAA